MENIYTDLALEMAEQLDGAQNLDGVEITTDERECITINTIRITNEAGAAAMGKPIGNYITVESPEIKVNTIDVHEQIAVILAEKLALLARQLNCDKDGAALIIGLGNRNVTPDSLGPLVVAKTLITRHIMEGLPVELVGKMRSVAGIAPGVMGLTGIETLEIVKGLVSHVKPSLIIAIDALAARSINRINQTIQLTDTGICPGAGIGNKRMPLDSTTLGVPIIAIGVPTVADAAVFAGDAMERFFASLEHSAPELLEGCDGFLQMLENISDDDKHAAIRAAILPVVGNMFVTPKEIGEVVTRLAGMIANGINIAMHEGISREDINRFVY